MRTEKVRVNWADYGRLLRKYSRPYWVLITVLLLSLCATTLISLWIPRLISAFIDMAKARESLDSLARIAWTYIGLGVLNQGCAIVNTYVSADVGWRATNALRADLVLHCLRLDMPFHHSMTPGEMIERVDGDVTAVANLLSQFLAFIIGNILLLAGVLVAVFFIDWRIGAVIAANTIISAAGLMRTRNMAVPIFKNERASVAAMSGFVEERLGGLDDIRANGIGAYTMHRFALLVSDLFHKVQKAWLMRNIIWSLSSALFLVGSIATLVVSTVLHQRDPAFFTLGTIFLVWQYNNMLRAPLEQLSRQLAEFHQATAAISRINELFALQAEVLDGPGDPLPDGALSVEFEHVTFAYGDAAPVLHDLSFSLSAGQVLGILGRTGSGKTTMMRLLFRLYDIPTGVVRVGGVDIRRPTLSELRRRIGLVTQDVQLFHASVRDNLTFFDAAISDARIMEVIDELELREWITALPEGLDTMLHAGGAGLSAGESQLLAFTRVFLQNPNLVLLDEPSSRLDPATEHLIERAIDRLLSERTCIIIAHRLATVQRADEILILEDGRILEHGMRKALAEDAASHFAHLLRTGLEKELA